MKIPLCMAASALLLAAASPGIHPRAGADRYPVHQEGVDFAIGATMIPPSQVKKIFAADLNHPGYIVVEVGAFPSKGALMDLAPGDFTLWVGEGIAALRPVGSDAIAQVLVGRDDDLPPQRRPPYGVDAGGTVGIGRSTYPGQPGSQTGVGTSTGVGGQYPDNCRGGYGCESTPYPQAPIPVSRTQSKNAIEQELWEKSLPDAPTTQPVAGYLYFPKPSGKAKNNQWELRYEPASGRVSLPLDRSR